MSLPYLKRSVEKKSEVKRLKREGYIPAVIYGRHGKVGEPIAIPTSGYLAIARKVQPGHLPTTIFTIVDEKKHERRVIVKDIQYAIPSYDVAHIDFEELIDGVSLSVKVPIECVGMVDCVGIKLGGVLRQVIRHLKVRCEPKDIPSFFQFDVKEMSLFQSKRLSELQIPKGVKPLVDVNEVAIAIVKR